MSWLPALPATERTHSLLCEQTQAWLQAPSGPRLMPALLSHCSPGRQVGTWWQPGSTQEPWQIFYRTLQKSWPGQSEELRQPHLCLPSPLRPREKALLQAAVLTGHTWPYEDTRQQPDPLIPEPRQAGTLRQLLLSMGLSVFTKLLC